MALQDYLKQNKTSILNLGCGKTCPVEHYGIDITDSAGVDQVEDLNQGIPIPNDTFDIVVAQDFLEHIEQRNGIMIMEEIYRVLKPGGILKALVPSTDGNNIGAFQDPTHVSFWNGNKFLYFLNDECGKSLRGLYNIKCWFQPISILTYNNEWDVTYVDVELRKKD